MSERLVIIFFWLAFMTYAAAFVFYLYLFINKRQILSIMATSLAALGLLFQTLSLAARWKSVGYIPVAGAFESYFLFAWALVLIVLVTETLNKTKVLGAWVMPFVGALLGIAWVKYESPERLSDVVKNSWIVMHVSVVFLAYAGFTIGAVFAVLYLIQQRQLKQRHVNIFFRRLPSLEVLDDLSNKAISVALPFMTMTIITGMLKAIKEFPNWYFDPVVVSATATWLLYGMYLGLRYLWDWQGRRIAYFAIAGFFSIFLIRVMTYFPIFHKFG